jgi:nicotinamidase-related amidase
MTSRADRTALLLIECQRGVVGDLSILPALAEAAGPVLPEIGRLASAARTAKVHVAHLTYLPIADGRSTNRKSPMMRATQVSADWSPSHPAAQVVDEIGVGPHDMVLARHQGISPVYRTETLTILRNLGVEEVVVAGVSTNWAIPLAAAAASDEDFAVTIPTDAVAGAPADHHASMIRNALGFVARLTTVDELIAAWRP